MSWRKLDPPASLNGVLRPFTVSVRKGGVFLSQDLARSIQERRFDLLLDEAGAAFAFRFHPGGAWRRQASDHAKVLGTATLRSALLVPLGLYPVQWEGDLLVHRPPADARTQTIELLTTIGFAVGRYLSGAYRIAGSASDLFHVAKKVATGRMSVDALAETFRVKMHVAAKFMLEFGPALEEYERLPEAERPGALAAWLAYFEEGAK